MQNKLKLLNGAILLACGSFSCQSLAVLSPRAILNFNACALTSGSSPVCLQTGGSWFSMDNNGDSKVAAFERVSLSSYNGLYIGTTQIASGSHGGAPYAVDLLPDGITPDLTTTECEGLEACGIDRPWSFFGSTGMDFTATNTNILSASGNSATVDFSGWRVTWQGIPSINMGQNAWDPLSGTVAGPYTSGVARITCAVDCATGDTYQLNYSATVPVGDPSGFGGIKYFVHLEGTIGTYNVAPVASNSNSAGVASTTFSINLLPNITDANNNIDLTSLVPSATTPACGTPTDNNDGTVTFPACAANTYTFTYTIADTDAAVSNTATVTVVVAANPAPDTVADLAETNGSTPVIINVTGNDSDNNNLMDLTSVAIASPPTHGGTSINATNGDITYTANAGFAGIDTFTYTIADEQPLISAAALVTVTVNAMNVPSSSNALVPGTVAVAAGSTNGIVTYANIGVADNGDSAEQGITQSCIGGCFDFVVSGLTNGATAQIVLPLSTAIPAVTTGNNIQYRKVISGTWAAFATDTSGNNLSSAAGTVIGSDITCPPPGSTSYTSGLTAGDRCIRLSIVDGGLNDADGAANGTVVDPGGLAQTAQIDTRVSGTESGCSMTGNNNRASDHADWLLLAGFMGMLGWFGMKRRQA